MEILQLCCFSNLWPSDCNVTSFDLKLGLNVFDLPDNYGKDFDLVVAAPPCTQFTKANSSKWLSFPKDDILLADKCFRICRSSSRYWFLENPPGRLPSFLPGLIRFRTLTWSGGITNKEYVIFSNFLILYAYFNRYGKNVIARSKINREIWQPDFVRTIYESIVIE